MERKYKTFGDVKVGDVLYIIEYGDIPSIFEGHASKVEYPSDKSVTITIAEKVPNSPEKEGEFKINLVSRDADKTYYDVFTTEIDAKRKIYNMLLDKIKDNQAEIGIALMKIDSCKELIKKQKEEIKKYDV
jgi:effector-binding domain-containing protein